MSPRFAPGLLVVLLACFFPRPAFAADPVADALFTSAKALAAEGKFAEACPKFEESYRLDPLLGVLLNLAYCLEQEGRVASSWTRWGEASEIAARTGDDRKGYADEHRALTEARLSRLRITTTGKGDGLKVYRNTTPIGTAMFGTDLPMDPGEHLIEVARGDVLLHRESALLAEAETKTVSLDLDAIALLPPKGLRKGASPPPPDKPAERSVPPPTLIPGVAIGSVGVAAAIAGAVIGGLSLSMVGDASGDRALCTPGNLCTAEGLEAVSEAETFAHASTGLLIGGGTLTALGVVLIIVGLPSDAAPDRAWLDGLEIAFEGSRLGDGGHLEVTMRLP